MLLQPGSVRLLHGLPLTASQVDDDDDDDGTLKKGGCGGDADGMGAGRIGRPRALHAAGKVCGDGVDLDDEGVATGVCRASFGWCSTFGDADALVATIAEHFAEEERVATSHASGSSTEREASTATVASVCVYPLKSAAAFRPRPDRGPSVPTASCSTGSGRWYRPGASSCSRERARVS